MYTRVGPFQRDELDLAVFRKERHRLRREYHGEDESDYSDDDNDDRGRNIDGRDYPVDGDDIDDDLDMDLSTQRSGEYDGRSMNIVQHLSLMDDFFTRPLAIQVGPVALQVFMVSRWF